MLRLSRLFLKVTLLTALALLAGDISGRASLVFQNLYTLPNSMNLRSGLVKGRDGNFYGLVMEGGSTGGGALYKLTPSGAFSIAFEFPFAGSLGETINEIGSFPEGSLAVGDDGTIYGTTRAGGAHAWGTIFAYRPDGTIEAVHHFNAGLTKRGVLIKDGDLYGITPEGSLIDGIFRFSRSGQYEIVLNLETDPVASSGMFERKEPSGLISLMAANDEIYGTTGKGGKVIHTPSSYYKEQTCGTILRLDADHDAKVVFEEFELESRNPYGLVEGPDESLYGISGSNYPPSKLFNVSKTGDSFRLIPGIENPYCLMVASDGNLYGATFDGGLHGAGYVFQLTPEDVVTRLYEFPAEFYGMGRSALVEGADGFLYATLQGAEEAEAQVVGKTAAAKAGATVKYKPSRIFRLRLGDAKKINNQPMARNDEVPVDDLRRRQSPTAKPDLKNARIPAGLVSKGNVFLRLNDYEESSSSMGVPMIEVEIDVLKNDKDADRDSLSIVSVGTPSRGTVSIDSAAQKLKYRTTALEADKFFYEITDGRGGTSFADVHIVPPIQGTYSGVLTDSAPLPRTMALNVVVSAKKKVTAKATLDKKVYTISGVLNGFGRLIKSLNKNGTVVTFEFEARPNATTWEVESKISIGNKLFEGVCSAQ